MLFISSKKLSLFSRYSNFCISKFPSLFPLGHCFRGYLIGVKKSREKWRNFSPTFFFPTSIFPRLFFTWQRIYSDFSYPELLLLFTIYLQNLLLPFFFFWCTLSIFNKNFEIRVESKELKKITAIIVIRKR